MPVRRVIFNIHHRMHSFHFFVDFLTVAFGTETNPSYGIEPGGGIGFFQRTPAESLSFRRPIEGSSRFEPYDMKSDRQFGGRGIREFLLAVLQKMSARRAGGRARSMKIGKIMV
ncbi:hypothetical protein DPQ33_03090 [Oceanidesulfovibrio indonesiensis]|uniref:Uncharacterized protein n=1 Tax=Oceanidesulfovibrio indonesiensis TaxID=54767 RepID=A0A7M3MIY2_9BACT|nr:hypothetical protein DPQ33_03090 [Oceanidesulfovibrio indonesiensis]